MCEQPFGVGENDWYEKFNSDSENECDKESSFRESRRSTRRNAFSSDDESSGETIGSVSSVKSMEEGSSVGSFLQSDSGSSSRRRLSAGILEHLGKRIGRQQTLYDDFWKRYSGERKYFGRKIVSSIVDCPTSGHFKKIFPKLISNLSSRHFVTIGWHEKNCFSTNGPHIHVHHDCNWNSERCKCIKFPVRPRLRTQHSTGEGTAIYVNSVLEYYQKDERRINYVKIGKFDRTLAVPNQSLQYAGSHWSSLHGAIEASEGIGTDFDGPHEPHGSQIAKLNNGAGRADDFKRSCRKAVPGQLKKFILDHPTFPASNVMECKQWNQSEYSNLLTSDKVWQRAIQGVNLKYMLMSYDDYVNYYAMVKEENLIFATKKIPFNDYYFDIDESLLRIEEILDFQLNDNNMNPDAIPEFFQNVYDIVECKLPKKNTMYVVGAPSSGKNYIFDSLMTFFLNIGVVANFNSTCAFPLNDCKMRRLIFWNEPILEPAAHEALKMLTGGDPCPSRVKYGADYIIPRTPVFILSNKDKFKPQSNLAFGERFISYINWSTLPWEKVNKKPHPFVWVKAFNKYQCGEKYK
uniref:Nonstructural protein 1 n=1 Tax=Periparus ater parvoviridae sp. TaxID=2794527 RepID=A0A8A4XD77_9VIRU|nr:MAG: nonstructural protein 1 [Periparus ater parvoviridae sp.]